MHMKSHQHTDEKETLILDAAQRRFAGYGFSKVTMDEIALDVGMAKASLYYYYPTKEDIFRAVIRKEQHAFIEHMTALMEHPATPGKKLREYVQRRSKLSRQFTNLTSLGSHSWQELNPLFHDLFRVFCNEEKHLLMRIIREGKDSGEFDVASPERTATLILHALQGLRFRYYNAQESVGAAASNIEGLENDTHSLIETLLTGIIKRTRQ
jgi:AcrR family transcriptional regulator